MFIRYRRRCNVKIYPIFPVVITEYLIDVQKFISKVTNTEWNMHVIMINGADTFIWLGRGTGLYQITNLISVISIVIPARAVSILRMIEVIFQSFNLIFQIIFLVFKVIIFTSKLSLLMHKL